MAQAEPAYARNYNASPSSSWAQAQEDDIGERLLLDSGETIHLFEGFALVNYLLCSAVEEGSKKGRATKLMIVNCGRHFKKAIDILKPTLLILQGYGVHRWLAQAYHQRPWEKGDAAESLDLDGTKVLTFYHPSYRGCPWGRALQSKYLDETIIPTIRKARRKSTLA
jgi:uracil-DNA glycosylase